MKYVLDASAVIAFLREEPGALRVRDILLGMANEVYIHAANAIEVHYKPSNLGLSFTTVTPYKNPPEKTSSTFHKKEFTTTCA